MDKLNWVLLGTGTIAKEFAGNFEAKQAVLYGVASRTEEKARAFAETYGISQAYGSYEQALADPEVHVVYIALPHSHHYQWIKAALEAGKHVLCEKVITVNKKQLDELADLAIRKQLYLMEAMTIYHMPLYRKLKEFIAARKLGPVKMIQAPFGSFKAEDPSLYFFRKDLAGGALFDIGTYALSFARFFMQSAPTEVKTIGTLHESGVDESSAIILRNAEKEMATVSLTFRAKMPKVGIVAFEKGYFTIGDYPRPSEAVFTDASGKSLTLEAEAKNGLMIEVADMTEMILKQGENETLHYTLDVLEIMDTVRKEWGLVYPFE